MKIEIEGLRREPRLHTRILARVAKACGRLPDAPTSALVNFTDVNGPKGGVDMRCAVTVWVPGKKTAHVEDIATSPSAAFDAVIDSLERWVKEHTERIMDDRRRPKKYYLAKRLLEPEAGAGPPSQPPSPAALRRRRRNRAA